MLSSDWSSVVGSSDLARLTERFYRVDPGRSRSVGGTGLGLAIVKHIVERHPGQLLIDSEIGVGTRVTALLQTAASGSYDRRVGEEWVGTCSSRCSQYPAKKKAEDTQKQTQR